MRGRVQRRHGAGICAVWLRRRRRHLRVLALCASSFPSLLPSFAWPTRTQLQIYARHHHHHQKGQEGGEGWGRRRDDLTSPRLPHDRITLLTHCMYDVIFTSSI